MMANVLSEVAVEYPDSPLNSSHDFERSEPAPGKRAPVHGGELAVGAGPTPHFVLCAAETKGHQHILTEFDGILEQRLRRPYDPKGIWLVRPDGYVALRTRSGHTEAIEKYLRGLKT
jgi:hypothetical protein